MFIAGVVASGSWCLSAKECRYFGLHNKCLGIVVICGRLYGGPGFCMMLETGFRQRKGAREEVMSYLVEELKLDVVNTVDGASALWMPKLIATSPRPKHA